MSDRYARYRWLKIDRPAERVLRLTLDEPGKLNAIGARAHEELAYVWNDIDRDADVACVLVTGAGEAFSAGGDLAMVERIVDDFEYRTRAWKEARDLVYNIVNCGKPIVSAITGPAVGAGLVAALLADVSIAGRKARIIDGHTRLGVAAGDHSAMIWPLLCGMAKAKYYLMTCDRMPAEEAERIGLLSMCVEDGELEAKTMEVAAKIASGAPNAIRWTKYALNNWLRMAGPSFDASTALEMLGFLGPEGREGLQALQEKRAPDFPKDSPI